MTQPHILIVDDNLMNLALVTYLLEADGLLVSAAQDADAARSGIAAHAPDLILMDIQLPGIDGLTFTRELKCAPATRHIPVVALTAYAMKGDEARMREAGCTGYLTKPIDVAHFAGKIRAYLQDSISSSADF